MTLRNGNLKVKDLISIFRFIFYVEINLFSTQKMIALPANTEGSQDSKFNVIKLSKKFQRYESFSSFRVFRVSGANIACPVLMSESLIED